MQGWCAVIREAFKKYLQKHMEFSICWLTILYYIIVYQVDFKLVFGLEFPLGNPNPRFHLVGDDDGIE